MNRVRKASHATQLLSKAGVVYLLQFNASEYSDCDSLSRFSIARGFTSKINTGYDYGNKLASIVMWCNDS